MFIIKEWKWFYVFSYLKFKIVNFELNDWFNGKICMFDWNKSILIFNNILLRIKN